MNGIIINIIIIMMKKHTNRTKKSTNNFNSSGSTQKFTISCLTMMFSLVVNFFKVGWQFVYKIESWRGAVCCAVRGLQVIMMKLTRWSQAHIYAFNANYWVVTAQFYFQFINGNLLLEIGAIGHFSNDIDDSNSSNSNVRDLIEFYSMTTF